LKNIRISAFSDEVHNDPIEAFSIMKNLGVEGIQLRSVNGANVMDLNKSQIQDTKKLADDLGMTFHAIGSPIGKSNISDDEGKVYDSIKLVAEIANELETDRIRIFSFYSNYDHKDILYRNLVIERLNEMVRIADENSVKLIHENEKEIYGDNAERCNDILENVKRLGCCFDFANFIQVNQDTLEAWDILSQKVIYFDVKDAIYSSGLVVPAGEGEGNLVKIFKKAFDRGFSDWFNIEPHLRVADGSEWIEGGPQLFKTAVKALNNCIDQSLD
tara:strand:+ start:1581 stop:2399 length:819 start_codon:yes stop_codon:yes gene_type:complete